MKESKPVTAALLVKDGQMETKCCEVPTHLHGTCCGWQNANIQCSPEGIITDSRHPGFGQKFDQWSKPVTGNKTPMPEPKRVKKEWKSDKPFADFSDAMSHFINSNCLRATISDETTEETFVECDIRIHLNGRGGGYIHLLNQDSDTIDFRTMDHYKLTNTPKPKHLR